MIKNMEPKTAKLFVVRNSYDTDYDYDTDPDYDSTPDYDTDYSYDSDPNYETDDCFAQPIAA